MRRVVFSMVISVLCPQTGWTDLQGEPFERTEEREPCSSYEELTQPFFGTTHVHTRLSFDASIRFVPPDPKDAFAFAKRERAVLGADPMGLPTRKYGPAYPPLDWAAVTDHSEHMAEVSICHSEQHHNPADGLPGRNSFDCKMLNGFYYQPALTADGAIDYPDDCLQEIYEKTGRCILPQSGTMVFASLHPNSLARANRLYTRLWNWDAVGLLVRRSFVLLDRVGAWEVQAAFSLGSRA